jgi:hypothetical protein
VDYRHRNASRLNIPPAGLAARGEIAGEKKVKYAYNPHLKPALRFDGTGGADRVSALLEQAGKRQFTADEVKLLQEAFRCDGATQAAIQETRTRASASTWPRSGRT